jgi:putative RNA 2'-phosphotransferase
VSRVTQSKFLSLVLRHDPASIGLTLDAAGWAEIAELLERAAAASQPLSRADLVELVATSDKQRFAISEDGRRIRANQGHSIAVDLGLEPRQPPELLYHGTAARFLASIRAQGLVRGDRQQVHLSADPVTAAQVGQRHGQPVVLGVRAAAMAGAGMRFQRSANGVWLTLAVPPEFLEFPD